MAGRRAPALVLAGACALGSAYLLQAYGDAAKVEDARRALGRGDAARAAALAGEVERPPAGADAQQIRATALALGGSLRASERAYRQALRRRPNSWELRRAHALVLLRLGERNAARREIQRALGLNPRMELPPQFVVRG